ncbi:MAG: hypothetical protein WHV67_00390 [Thermoanaerobaculia bacterium]
MARYGVLYLEKNNFYAALLSKKKESILVEDFYEETFEEEIFKITSFGVLPQDLKVLDKKIKELISASKVKNWCLLLPDWWQKSLILEEENIPKAPKELKSFLEWHFKKAYNLRPEEVRFSYLLQNGNGKNRVLITFCLEKLISLLEEIFRSKKKHLGFITSSFWALSFLVPKKGTWALLSIEKNLWTLGIFEEEKLLSLRQKILPEENFSLMKEEIERTLNLNEKTVENFYLNLNNPYFESENFYLDFNFLTLSPEGVKVLKEAPLWWERFKGPFLGVLYGIP